MRGYPQVPVVSLNFSGLEKDSGFPMTVSFMRKLLATIYYGDLLVALRAQTEPYELQKGAAEAVQEKWLDTICGWVHEDRGWSGREIKAAMPEIAADFAAIPVRRVPKVKVGVVGEIYVKYSHMANNHLEQFLLDQGCQVNVPGLMGFLLNALDHSIDDVDLYGGNRVKQFGFKQVMRYVNHVEQTISKAIRINSRFNPPTPYKVTRRELGDTLGVGCKMGEGWLLTAEMCELIDSGVPNIVCVQPFGCLPNHIAGKGTIRALREKYPRANIVPIDYDPGATRVNQENRLKLMLAVAREEK